MPQMLELVNVRAISLIRRSDRSVLVTISLASELEPVRLVLKAFKGQGREHIAIAQLHPDPLQELPK